MTDKTGFNEVVDLVKEVSKMQGDRQHLATKADIEQLKTEITKKSMSRIEWIAILVPATMGALIGIAAAVGQYLK